MLGLAAGSVSPGTLPGEAAIQIPSATNASAATRDSRKPCGSTFSAKITAAVSAIQNRLITPSANRINISPQQQPTQYVPCSRPNLTAPVLPSLQPRMTKSIGPRQWRRQISLSGVNSYKPAAVTAPPAT